SKIYDGSDFRGLDPSHLPSEEVSDVIQNHMNYFAELEAAAEVISTELDRRDLCRSMIQYLRDRHKVEVGLGSGAVRRFDRDRRTLTLSELLPPSSRNFQLAHQIGFLGAQPVIEAIITRAQKNLTTPESVTLC